MGWSKRRVVAGWAAVVLTVGVSIVATPSIGSSTATPSSGRHTSVPASGTGGVLVLGNLTVTDPDEAGYTTAYPCAEGRPPTSNNNYAAGQTIPNFAAVRTDVNGDLCFFTSRRAHLIWDQVSELPGLPSHNAVRLLDTRTTGKPSPGSVTKVHVSDVGGVMVLGNLTVTHPEAKGFTTAYPCAEGRPPTSNNNYLAGQTTPNFVAVRADANGDLCIFTAASADLVWDQVSELPGLPSHNAVRLLDTRTVPPLGPLVVVAGKTILVDPGHNGNNRLHPEIINRPVFIGTKTITCDTTGTGSHNLTESFYNLDVALRLRAILQLWGANVVMTRTTDNGVGPCINERAAIGNRAHADVGISIHADGGPVRGRGFHVIFPLSIPGLTDRIAANSLRLALNVRAAYLAGTNMPYATYIGTGNGLSERNDLGGLNLSTLPKVFIETGNMKSETDIAFMLSPIFRQQAAQAIARGLAAYLAKPGANSVTKVHAITP